MRKSNLLRLAAAVCVLALLAGGLMIFFRGFHIGLNYAHAEAYTAGGTEITDAVKHLDIHWTEGAVNLAYHDKATIEIAETAPKAIGADAALRWWLDGDTLRVQYAKSGYFSFRGLHKALTVTLPRGMALDSVAIEATSADVNVPDLRAGTVDIGLTSGDLAFRQSGASKAVALSSTSGSITADVDEVETLNASITSGDIRVALNRADAVALSTTSGNIDLAGGDVQAASIDTTSGAVGVSLEAFGELRVDATSGGVTAALPTEPGYRAEIDTTSGKVSYTVALARDGETYTCGDASAHVRIDTTSGDVRLEEAGK